MWDAIFKLATHARYDRLWNAVLCHGPFSSSTSTVMQRP